MIKKIKFFLKKFFFTVSEKITRYSKEKSNFERKLGYRLNLKNPESFNQKIIWKKIYDRNPLLPIVADKYKVREYLKKILGEKEAERILIPLFCVVDDPRKIPFDKLPDEYIIKTNHGSGWNIIVEEGMPINKKETINQCRKWLGENYGFFKHEWAYQKIPRKIIIEKLLYDEYQEIPKDFKFYIFHGKCRLVHVDFNRFSNHSRSLFDPYWNFLPLTLKFPQGPKVKKPFNYEKMVQLAEKIGKNFDFVRIDLYEINNKIYFGEFTHYPETGMGKFNPQSFDFMLGKEWKLNPYYWKK